VLVSVGRAVTVRAAASTGRQGLDGSDVAGVGHAYVPIAPGGLYPLLKLRDLDHLDARVCRAWSGQSAGLHGLWVPKTCVTLTYALRDAVGSVT
jgi:hypothetical protein